LEYLIRGNLTTCSEFIYKLMNFSSSMFVSIIRIFFGSILSCYYFDYRVCIEFVLYY